MLRDGADAARLREQEAVVEAVPSLVGIVEECRAKGGRLVAGSGPDGYRLEFDRPNGFAVNGPYLNEVAQRFALRLSEWRDPHG